MEDENQDLQVAQVDPTDLPIAQRGGLDIAALLQQVNTGAQGRPMPSYTADAANTGSRVAKILESRLRDMEQDKGFGRIAAAASGDIASGGRTPYAMLAQQYEGREVGQAVNIANSMAAVSRIGGQNNLGNLLQRRTEAAAREGNMKAQRINEMVRAAASGFDDSAMASAHLYGYLARKQKENPNLDLNELPGLMAEAIMDARRAGISRKIPGRGGRSSGGGGGGPSASALPAGLPVSADGAPDFSKPFPKPKTEFERTWNMSNAEARKKMFEARQRKLMGEEGGGGPSLTYRTPDGSEITFGAGAPSGKAAADKVTAELNSRLETADRVSAIMDRIRGELDRTGATSIGALGSISTFTGGLRSQVRAALDSMKDDPESPTLNRWLGNADAAFNEVLGANPRAAWLVGNNSEGAQRIRTNIMLLAYAHSKAMDPGGRIARDDVENTLRAIGERAGSPEGLRVALDELFRDMKAGLESSWMRRKGEQIEYTPGQPVRKRGGAAPAAPNVREMSTEDLLKELDK